MSNPNQNQDGAAPFRLDRGPRDPPHPFVNMQPIPEYLYGPPPHLPAIPQPYGSFLASELNPDLDPDPDPILAATQAPFTISDFVEPIEDEIEEGNVHGQGDDILWGDWLENDDEEEEEEEDGEEGQIEEQQMVALLVAAFELTCI